MKKYTPSEIEDFIVRFESCLVPKIEWTYETHLLVAIRYCIKYDLEDCMDEVRKRIKAHNVSIGIPNTESRWYIETTTYFWIFTVKNALEKYKNHSFEDKLHNMIEEFWDAQSIIYKYFTKEYMRSWPRSQLLPPDVKDFYHLKKK